MTVISEYFMEGNPLCMSVLTLLLALVFLAAWKAPAWVRNIGIIALACGFLFGLMGLYQMYGVLQESLRVFNENGDISPYNLIPPPVVFGGYRCGLIPIIYGTIIFIISQITYLCQKPRI